MRQGRFSTCAACHCTRHTAWRPITPNYIGPPSTLHGSRQGGGARLGRLEVAAHDERAQEHGGRARAPAGGAQQRQQRGREHAALGAAREAQRIPAQLAARAQRSQDSLSIALLGDINTRRLSLQEHTCVPPVPGGGSRG